MSAVKPDLDLTFKSENIQVNKSHFDLVKFQNNKKWIRQYQAGIVPNLKTILLGLLKWLRLNYVKTRFTFFGLVSTDLRLSIIGLETCIEKTFNLTSTCPHAVETSVDSTWDLTWTFLDWTETSTGFETCIDKTWTVTWTCQFETWYLC